MKVTISVLGRFHAFYLAKKLEERGLLDRLISSYPTFQISKYGISNEHISSIWPIEVLIRAWRKLPANLKSNINLQLWFAEAYDDLALKHVSSETDLFVGWSSHCLKSLSRARQLGATTIVERGSSHISHQTEILTEEYSRFGQSFTATHPGIQDREIEEYARADKISVPSLYVKRTFLERGFPEEKLVHTPYGVDLKEFYQVPKNDSVFRVIHCGGIRLRKGVHYLLQAFYELNLPNSELWLVGSVAPEIEPFLKKYQSDKIILKGQQPQNKLYWFYSQCSVFCLASLEEGLAMVQPQAMACGLPVIHTTNTGGSDIVRPGIDGFCIPIRSVEAIKEKILFFYDNPDRCIEMGSNASKRAQESFSWADYGNNIIKNYQSCIAK